MKSNRIIPGFLALVLAMSMLAGCGNNNQAAAETPAATEAPAEDKQTETPAEETPAAAETEAETRTITDASGNPVEVPAVINKIAFTTWPAGEAITIMLEKKDLLATISTTNAGNELISKYYPEIGELPTTPDIADGNAEGYLANGVELVFTSEQNREMFENAGIAVLVADMSSAEAMMNTILMMGEAFGEDSFAKAQTFVDYYHDNMDRLSAVSEKLSDEEKPRVYYAAGGLLNTEGSGSITNSWMGAAGGINVATENGIEGTFIDISAETLLDWDPDVIILRDANYYEEILNDPVLNQLTAVQNGKFYVAPKGIYNWAVRASEAAIMPLWAATVISPELYSDIDIEQETRDFHSVYYGMELDDTEVFNILHPAGV